MSATNMVKNVGNLVKNNDFNYADILIEYNVLPHKTNSGFGKLNKMFSFVPLRAITQYWCKISNHRFLFF